MKRFSWHRRAGISLRRAFRLLATPSKGKPRRAGSNVVLFAALASIALGLSSCAWIGAALDPLNDSDSGLPKQYWPAMPLADKTFIFSTSGQLIDIVYLNLNCVHAQCTPTRRSIALHGKEFLSAPIGLNGQGPVPTTSQAAAVAASSPLAASSAAAAPANNPDASELVIEMSPQTPPSGEAVFVTSAKRAAGSEHWSFSQALGVSRLASSPPVVLGVARPDSLILIDALGQLNALDQWKEPQAREELKKRGVALPPEPPPPTKRPVDESKAKPDPEKGFFRSLFSKPGDTN